MEKTINGKKLEITLSSFKEVMQLKKAVEKAIQRQGLVIDIDGVDMENIMNSKVSEGSVSSIISSILAVDTSEDVERLLFVCAERATYDNHKINAEFFEHPDNTGNWELYYPIMFEVLKVNLSPFFKGLLSLFGSSSAILAALLKSK